MRKVLILAMFLMLGSVCFAESRGYHGYAGRGYSHGNTYRGHSYYRGYGGGFGVGFGVGYAPYYGGAYYNPYYRPYYYPYAPYGYAGPYYAAPYYYRPRVFVAPGLVIRDHWGGHGRRR